MKAIIFGPPGSGKGTYASIIQEKIGTIKISTGDIVREEERKGTELGKMMKQYKDKGLLVPDEIIIEVLKKRISQPDCIEKGFILDGYPRTIPQAKALDKITPIDVIINLILPNWVIIERLTNRRICKNGHSFNLIYHPPKVPDICDVCGSELYQRSDDKREVVEKRVRVYEEQTKPILDYYKEKVPFVEIKPEPKAPPEKNAKKILVMLKEQAFY